MNRSARTPGWGPVFRVQLRRTLGARPAVACLLLSLVAVQVAALAGTGVVFGARFTTEGAGAEATTTVSGLGMGSYRDLGYGDAIDEGLAALWLAGVAGLLLGVLWPMRVWGGEPAANRDYHWAMPVRRSLHDLLRVLAGATWVGLLAAALALLAASAAAVSGHAVLFPRLTPWFWLNLIVAPLLLYTLASIPYVRAASRPGVWLWGGFLAAATLLNLGAEGAPAPVAAVVRPLTAGPVGVLRTLFSPLFGEVLGTTSTSGPHLMLGWLLWGSLFGTGLWIASTTRSKRL